MIHNYSIEIQNIKANRWELVDTAPTIDEAFDTAERYIGFNSDYDCVAILDMAGLILWDSHGFRQGEGRKYVEPQKGELLTIKDEETLNEQTNVAPDGSV